MVISCYDAMFPLHKESTQQKSKVMLSPLKIRSPEDRQFRSINLFPSLSHRADEIIPAAPETLVELLRSIRDEKVLCPRPQLADDGLDLVARHGVQDVGRS